MKKLFYILLLLPHFAIAQISGVINIYTKVTAIDLTCNMVTVSPNANGFSVGDIVLLIQMQGAIMEDQSNSASFGDINDINNTGNYEFGEIAAINSNDVYFKHTILRSYTPTAPGVVQLVSIPQYTDVTISGTLTAQAWDGETGGIVVFEASGIVTLNANIDVRGLGFRGGDASVSDNGYGCFNATGFPGSNNYFYTYPSPQGGKKGEGIAAWIATKDAGKGKNTNGGGGANGHNAGGGGGSNYGTGGRGGDKISSCGSGFYPNGPGVGGLSLTTHYSDDKIFLGGGGGGGQQNNWGSPGPPAFTGGTPGGPGGGIVIIKASSIDGNSNSILANGTLNSTIYRAWGDGAGGGGAGGTVLISSGSFVSALNVDVSGSDGDEIYDETGRNPGPGGGGGGGLLWVSTGAVDGNIVLTATGGAPGFVTGPGSCGGCNWAATAGADGGSLTNLSIPKSTTVFNQTCISLPVQIINYSAKHSNNKVSLTWITANEKNNQEFIIEKSKDLSEFDFVTSIPGSGNSSVSHTYSAFDYNPYHGDSYYRLSQKDMDGTVQVLKVAHVNSESSGNLIKKFYPQPFSTELNIELNEDALSDKAVISIYNTIGQAVFSIETRSSVVHLPLSHLPRGIYFLTVTSGDQKETVKVVNAE